MGFFFISKKLIDGCPAFTLTRIVLPTLLPSSVSFSMSYPIFISDDDATPPPPFPSNKRPRKNPPPTPTVETEASSSSPLLVDDDDDVTVVRCPLGSAAGSSSRRREEILAGKGVISLDSDSEDTPGAGAETSNKYGPTIHVDSLQHPCRLEPLTSDSDSDNSTDWLRGPSSQSSLPKVAIEVDSDQENEDVSVEKMSRQKQTSGSKSPSLSGNALPRKRLSKDERIRAAEEKKLRKEQEKLQRAASRAEEAEKRKLDKEMQKRGKGKLALKSIVAEIDLQLVEGALGAPLITLFAEKGITYRVISNPIKSSIVWTMTTLPEDVSQIPYVLLVHEAEEFCNLVANERLLENVSRVRDQYPSYTVCYLTNKLISYVEKREKKDYNVGKSNGWKRPPIDEVLAKLTTHYDRVHSRHCIDGPEVAAHVVGLTSSLASCHFRKKSSWLSVKAEGIVASMDSVDKHLIKKSPWLKALIAIPKVQPRYAVAVGKKYPTMKSLLKVYMDPNKSEQEKELLLKDLKLEGLTGKDANLGIVGSKRIYRVLMSRTGELKTDEVASQIYSPHDLD
ncbi:crossover junction endonuclease EME1A isoform X2 [Brassica napus]|uniref:crossover junction endonuclease EME1A isoform X2 n=1 Tax=Brassica napus TaxID=3708 RepID=UPI00207A1A97|nr:crossover junction endonuclease EME1A isoform X2 [Brassica napus]